MGIIYYLLPMVAPGIKRNNIHKVDKTVLIDGKF